MISPIGSTTADDLLNLQEDGNRYELVAGQVKKTSPAGSEHGRIADRIARRLGNHVEEQNSGQTFAAETGFRIASRPDTVRAPDAAFVSKERFDSAEPTAGYLPLAPDLAVEVISPSDAFADVQTKASAWLDAGSQMVIVADPRDVTLHIYRPNSNTVEILPADETLDTGTVAGGWKLSGRDVFGLT